jgi:hypothetical protein
MRKYYASGHPEQCKNHHITYNERREPIRRWECHARALFMIGSLQLCYGCFERHLSLHNVDFKLVRRLSDDEGDFTEKFGQRRGVRRVEATA